MAATIKSPRASSSNTSPRQSVVLTKGDWLDVMDLDGVWNVARVLSVPSPEEVEVMYDGWPEEYDEVLRVDCDRVAPYHTFTWAVKCWVKYLNWPMWPSVITIRTPGTVEGINNLAMEDRVYVDFLDDPVFAKRDRCWQKKRQVKFFDDHYEQNRMGTNGAQFEEALEFALRSNSTTKMPTFARGTLPMQYEKSTTESVERMRKNMGNGLWYRNFANNKKRHIQTHFYQAIGDDEEDSASNEAEPVPKLKVRRPITNKQQKSSNKQQKKKRPILAKKHQVAVKIEPESLAEVEIPYEPDETDSIETDNDRKDALTKKRRLRTSAVSPASNRAEKTKGKHLTSPQENNAAPSMPRHVTVMMDEIIVDDDEDSDDAGIDRWKVARNSGNSSSRKRRANSIAPREERRVLMDTVKGRERNMSIPTKSSIRRHTAKSKKNNLSAREVRPGSSNVSKTQSKSPRQLQAPLPLIDQRIAFAKEVLRELAKEKEQVTSKEQQKGLNSSTTTHDGSKTILSRAKKIEARVPPLETSDLSFLQAADKASRSEVGEDHEESVTEMSLDLDLESNELGHSFLSVDEAYSSDSQESKGVPVLFDEELMTDIRSDPNETKRAKKVEVKSLSQLRVAADAKQLAEDESDDEDDDGEEKCQEVRRHFCVMRAGLEGTLEIDDDTTAEPKTSSRTMISVSRMFDEQIKEASQVFTSLTDSMLRIAPPSLPPLSDCSDPSSGTPTTVFSSSDRFSMEKWFKRTLRIDYSIT